MKPQSQHLSSFFWLLLFLIIKTTTTLAQSHWQRIGTHQRSVKWLSNSTVISVGWHGVIMKSTDAGETWRYMESGTTDHLLGLYFIDSLHGFASSISGTILQTTDGGERWQPQNSPKQNILTRIAFATSQRGFILADSGRALRTNDGGNTWSVVQIYQESSQPLADIAFSDSLHGIIVGGKQNYGYVLRTTDGGETWKRLGVDSLPRYTGVSCNGATCAVVGYQVGPSRAGVVLISNDKFASWRLADTAGLNHYPNTVAVIDSQRIIAMGQLPRFTDTLGVLAVLTVDGGKTWKGIKSGIRTDVYGFSDIAKNSNNDLLGVGQNSCIVISKDNGKTWRELLYLKLWQLDIPPDDNLQYTDGYFFNDKTGVVIGGSGSGSVLRTTDGGLSWSSIDVPRRLKQLYVEDKIGTILALPWNGIYNSGFLLRGEDQGSKWSLVETSFNGLQYSYASGMQFLNSQRGFLATDSIIFTTTDGGRSWVNSIQSPAEQTLITSFHFLDDMQGWIGLLSLHREIHDVDTVFASRLYRTIDGGRSWQMKKEVFNKNFSFWLTSIACQNENKCWISYGLGDGSGYAPKMGRVYSTLDGGDHWDSINVDGAVTRIQFFSDSVGYIFGSNALLMKTTNAGKTWEREYVWPPQASDSSVVFRGGVLTPSARTMIVYGHGVLVRGEFATPVTSVPNEGEHNGGNNADVRVVPTISTNDRRRVEVPGSTVIRSIILRDILGRMIQTIPIENVGWSGEYQTLELNVADVAAGVYEVVVSSDNTQSVGRLVVVK
ncbi:MAG: hypothetical protein JNJ94_14155 [Chlorobi bacterium]|nr:hypothetical protein [Chlorobiota bacterium]